MAADDTPKPQAGGAPPMAWLLAGVLITLGVVVALRFADPASSAPAASTSTPSVAPATSHATAPSGSRAREAFADLYLDYLLKTYYVYERGFCKALLKEICGALLETKLVDSQATCTQVPNAELVLAIGRYQHQTGLPVDGKAGPETVRRMLGGGFTGRKGMAQKYCPGWRPPDATPSAQRPAPKPAKPATVDW